jgi:hypothetical protein
MLLTCSQELFLIRQLAKLQHSMSDRLQFQNLLKAVLMPVLKAEGFRNSGTTYRRAIGDIVHVIQIQGSQHGGQCCVCLGIHLAFLPTVGSNAPCDPTSIKEPECEFRCRLKPEGQSDQWWSYGTTEAEATASVCSIRDLYQQHGAPYFSRFSIFPDDFVRVTRETSDDEIGSLFPRCFTSVRRELALARIYGQIGDRVSAQFFAIRGMAAVGQATALKAAFSPYLIQA